MLQLLVSEAEQCPQVCAIAVPVALGDFDQVQRNEFLEVPEQMRVAERANVVERELFVRIQKRQVPCVRPRFRNDLLAGIEASTEKDLIDGPGEPLRSRDNRGVVHIVPGSMVRRLQRGTSSVRRAPGSYSTPWPRWCEALHRVEPPDRGRTLMRFSPHRRRAASGCRLWT